MRSDICRMRTTLEHSRSVLTCEGARRGPCRSRRYGAFCGAQGHGRKQSEAQRNDGAEANENSDGLTHLRQVF